MWPTIAETFIERIVKIVSGLKAGMPFEDKVILTQLPEDSAVAKMDRLTKEAVAKGAQVVNPGGGSIDRTFFRFED
jgi:glyceraldehyde-3-phosphate dehydrogenase (NADP+)